MTGFNKGERRLRINHKYDVDSRILLTWLCKIYPGIHRADNEILVFMYVLLWLTQTLHE